MGYIVLLLVSIALTIWLCLFSWKRRRAPGVTTFLAMLFFGLFWLVAITLMLLSPSQAMALFWYRLGFLSVSILPVLLFVFIAQYSKSRWITPTRLLLLFLIPIGTQIAIWTDDHLHFFFKSIDLVEKNGLIVIQSWTPGFWFVIHSVFSFTIMFIALIWLIKYAVHQFRVFRRQSLGFILGSLMVVLPNLAFAVGLIPPDIIILPFGFLLMVLFFAWAIFYHKLFEVVPVAYDKMFSIMSDGMIVLDTRNHIVAMNPAAQSALSLVGEDVVGQPAAVVFEQYPDILEQFLNIHSTQTELNLTAGTQESNFDIRITGLDDKKGRLAGRLILFRDITLRKKIEREKDQLLSELNQKNRELEVLYSLALDANPMTGLPGNNSVSAAITKALQDKAPLCVIYTDLDNFKAFNDKYGFAHGDEIIIFTADILKKSITEANCTASFIGHIGGDDFVLLVPSPKIQSVVDSIIQKFDETITQYYDDKEQQQGFISTENRQGERMDFPIMTISMVGVDLSQKHYAEYMAVNDACAELKKKSKSMPGSTFVLDMREMEVYHNPSDSQ